MAWSRQRSITAVAIVIVVALASIITPLMFINYRNINMNDSFSIKLDQGVDSIDLSVAATVGDLNISFAPLEGDAVRVYASVLGNSTYFGDASPLRVERTVTNDTENGGHTVTASVKLATYAPWPYYSISRVNYSVVIEESLRCKLNLSMTTGGISLATADGVVLEELKLNSTVDGAVVSLNNGTILAGDIHVRTATGGTRFYWNNLTVEGVPMVTLTESSGRIDARFYQYVPLEGIVDVRAIDTAGELKLRLEANASNSVGVVCTRSIGEAEVTDLGGFVGDAQTFRSMNFPSGEGFVIKANNTIGTILVTGRWTA